MGLKKELKLDNGVFAKDAYFRIDSISGFKGEITVSLNAYFSHEAFSQGSGYLEQKLYTFSPDVSEDSKGIWLQAYEYLKSLDDYKDATDH